MALSPALQQFGRVIFIFLLCCIVAGSVAVACLQMGGLPQWRSQATSASTPAPPTVRPPLPAGSYPQGPLDVGTALPEMEPEGWVNGSPASEIASGKRLIVLDIWAHWCPACRETAPALVELQKKFGDRVSFVSLTNVGQGQVESFADQAEIPWSCGYGASLESLAQFGVYSSQRMTANYNPGYEVLPTIYVIGADGRVLWHDNQARPLHRKLALDIVQDLENELTRLLAVES